MHVAQLVVLVQELGDRLGVLRRSRPHLDRVGRFCARLCAPRGSLDVVPAARSIAGQADGDLRRQALPLGTEIQEPHVPGVSCERGERLRQRPEVAPGARQRQAPVVHGDVDETVARLERHLDLAEVVVGVGVVKREADEALHDRAQPPLVLCWDSDSDCKGREEGQHQRRRARVAQDGDLHPRHGKRRC